MSRPILLKMNKVSFVAFIQSVKAENAQIEPIGEPSNNGGSPYADSDYMMICIFEDIQPIKILTSATDVVLLTSLLLLSWPVQLT